MNGDIQNMLRDRQNQYLQATVSGFKSCRLARLLNPLFRREAMISGSFDERASPFFHGAPHVNLRQY